MKVFIWRVTGRQYIRIRKNFLQPAEQAMTCLVATVHRSFDDAVRSAERVDGWAQVPDDIGARMGIRIHSVELIGDIDNPQDLRMQIADQELVDSVREQLTMAAFSSAPKDNAKAVKPEDERPRPAETSAGPSPVLQWSDLAWSAPVEPEVSQGQSPSSHPPAPAPSEGDSECDDEDF